MKPIEEAFDSLVVRVVEPKDIDARTRGEMRKIFFAGAITMMVAEGKRLSAARRELRQFMSDMGIGWDQ